ncbi:MAG: 7-cyano-7-deazaguanine synthase QueC [Endomicrobiia bacterium]
MKKRLNKKCVVLLSGGLDSSTTLFYVKKKGFRPQCLIFDYGQRHRKEINSAKKIASYLKVKYYIVKIQLPWKGSSLLDKNLSLPVKKIKNVIPSTYVPARNLIFLSFAVSFAETINARYVFYGANQIDFSGYPDCREEFINKLQETIDVGIKSSIKGEKIIIKAPLLKLSKEQIIKLALKLKVPLNLTWSCYKGDKKPCGVCDSCRIRAEGFKKADVEDPLLK